MGGCRCTYFGCKKSSDSVTHFFHYPVKDEERCLTWIQYAQRAEFKSLTKTQLNNKVICQYHFEDNMFMNYRHDRLVPKAVPMSVKTETIMELGSQEAPVLSEETDVKPTSKEVSTMSVNASPITGLSFIAPHEKRSKNVSSYLGLLTRQHSASLKSPKELSDNGTSIRKRGRRNQSAVSDSKDNMLIIYNSTSNTIQSASGPAPLKSMDVQSNVTVSANSNIKHIASSEPQAVDIKSAARVPSNNILVIAENKAIDAPQPMEINFIAAVTSSSFKNNNDVTPIPSNCSIGGLFKTPPKSINNTIHGSDGSGGDLGQLRKRKHIFPISKKSVSLLNKSSDNLMKSKIQIVSNEPFVTNEQHIAELINKRFSSSASDVKTTSEVNTISNKINIINKQLLLYNKQNDVFEKKKAKRSLTSQSASPEKKSPILVRSQVSDCQNVENISKCFAENIVPANRIFKSSYKNIVPVDKIDKSHSKNDSEVPINECIKLINKNSRDIAELKRMLLAQRVDKRVVANRKPRRISKSYLFTQIVPYLSPETAKMVHIEMFPFLARKKV